MAHLKIGLIKRIPIIQPPWASESIKHVNSWAILGTFQAEMSRRGLVLIAGVGRRCTPDLFFLGICKMNFRSKYEHEFSGIVVLRAARGLSYLIWFLHRGCRKSAGEFFSNVLFQNPMPAPTGSETLGIHMWMGRGECPVSFTRCRGKRPRGWVRSLKITQVFSWSPWGCSHRDTGRVCLEISI